MNSHGGRAAVTVAHIKYVGDFLDGDALIREVVERFCYRPVRAFAKEALYFEAHVINLFTKRRGATRQRSSPTREVAKCTELADAARKPSPPTPQTGV
jgi:transposase InsO family protein